MWSVYTLPEYMADIALLQFPPYNPLSCLHAILLARPPVRLLLAPRNTKICLHTSSLFPLINE